MVRVRFLRALPFVIASLVAATGAPGVAFAQPPPEGAATTGAGPAKPAGQGIAVLALGADHDDAYALARAIYGSRLRPAQLDEVRARVLAGGAPPANGTRELRDLAEIRAGITTEDAAARRLLTGLAQQVGAQALLVVKVEHGAASPPVTAPPPPPSATDWPSFEAKGAAGPTPQTTTPATGNVAGSSTVVARLFLADTGEFDAARYSPEPGAAGPLAWQSTVTSLEARFPGSPRVAGPGPALRAAPAVKPEEEKSTPFYASGWFWGSVGAAALLGAAFYFASRDTSSDPIHLQAHVPR